MTENLQLPHLFNFEDVERQAKEYLNQIRQQGRQILEETVAQAEEKSEKILREANKQLTSAQETGFQQGFQQGYSQGEEERQQEVLQLVQRKIDAELQLSAVSFQKIVLEFQKLQALLVQHWEKGFLSLVTSVAECILRQKLKEEPAIEANWIRESLQLCAGENRIQLRMNPEDHVLLNLTLQKMQEQFRHLGKIEICNDVTLDRGDCLVETEFGQMDQRVTSQLNRIREELEG